MSEEEKIKDIIEILELSKEEIENNNENITATLDLQDLKSLKNLLDLYNKEKEKNKGLLEGLKYRVNYCKLLEKELYNNGVNYNIELTKVEQDYLQDLLEEDNK